MEHVVRALGFLLIPVIVGGLLAVLRQPKKAKKGKVYLPAALAVIGIVGSTGFLIPALITAFTDDSPWFSLALLAFSLVGAFLIVSYINCRVSYDKDGFVAKNFWGIKRKYTYDQVTGIQEGMREDYLYVGKRRIMIDELAIGGAAFIGFVKKQYRTLHNGRELPAVRKTKGDIFNGNVQDVFGFMFAYISVGVLILVFAGFMAWEVFLTPCSVENTVEQQVSFESYTVEKTRIKLVSSDDRIYSVSTVGKEPDTDRIKALCGSETVYTVYVKEVTPDNGEVFFSVKAIKHEDSYILSFEESNARHRQEYRVLLLFPLGCASLWGVYVFFSIKVGRNPQKYSKKVIRLFFRDGYVKTN